MTVDRRSFLNRVGRLIPVAAVAPVAAVESLNRAEGASGGFLVEGPLPEPVDPRWPDAVWDYYLTEGGKWVTHEELRGVKSLYSGQHWSVDDLRRMGLKGRPAPMRINRIR